MVTIEAIAMDGMDPTTIMAIIIIYIIIPIIYMDTDITTIQQQDMLLLLIIIPIINHQLEQYMIMVLHNLKFIMNTNQFKNPILIMKLKPKWNIFLSKNSTPIITLWLMKLGMNQLVGWKKEQSMSHKNILKNMSIMSLDNNHTMLEKCKEDIQVSSIEESLVLSIMELPIYQVVDIMVVHHILVLHLMLIDNQLQAEAMEILDQDMVMAMVLAIDMVMEEHMDHIIIDQYHIDILISYQYINIISIYQYHINILKSFFIITLFYLILVVLYHSLILLVDVLNNRLCLVLQVIHFILDLLLLLFNSFLFDIIFFIIQ